MQEAVLYVDQGNTRAKFWRVTGGQTVCHGCAVDSMELQSQLGDQTVTSIVLASVRQDEAADVMLAPWRGTASTYTRVRVSSDILPTAYDDPRKLGIDRWLAVLAAMALGAGPALVIDAGTAITFDVLSPDGVHAGGYILPGLTLQQTALAAQTASVKFPCPDWQGQSLGKNTAAAVGHGSIRAMCALAREMTHELSPNEAPRLYLTGGNAQTLAAFLPAARVMDDLLLIGMQTYMMALSGMSLPSIREALQ